MFLAWITGSRRPRTRAKRKHVDLAKANFASQFACLHKVRLRLTGKADNDVCRECRLVERLEQIARFKSQAAGIAEEQGIDAGANHGIQ